MKKLIMRIFSGRRVRHKGRDRGSFALERRIWLIGIDPYSRKEDYYAISFLEALRFKIM